MDILYVIHQKYSQGRYNKHELMLTLQYNLKTCKGKIDAL